MKEIKIKFLNKTIPSRAMISPQPQTRPEKGEWRGSHQSWWRPKQVIKDIACGIFWLAIITLSVWGVLCAIADYSPIWR